MREPRDIADRVARALGLEPGDEIVIHTPQHERLPDEPAPHWRPTSAADLDALRSAPAAYLHDLGLRLWAKEDGQETWLYPGEWYDHIPDGYEVVDINGQAEPWKHGECDDDTRFGCLAFGFRRPTGGEGEDG